MSQPPPCEAVVPALAAVRGVVLDMDGTLVRSDYDWPAIRCRLGVREASILDEIAALPEPLRSERMAELERIERDATATAHLEPGATELLEVVRQQGLKAALVTNNTAANTAWILDRFDLVFDVVVTRDSGLWKPSGAPIAEALRQLGVGPAEALAVGDSVFDLTAARAAGCALVCVVNGGHASLRDRADLAFEDLTSLARCLEIVRPGPGE